MLTVGLYARLEAKPGKADELAGFLKQGLALANAETTTPVWFAVRFGPTTFAIFDAFTGEAGRQAPRRCPRTGRLTFLRPVRAIIDSRAEVSQPGFPPAPPPRRWSSSRSASLLVAVAARAQDAAAPAASPARSSRSAWAAWSGA